MKVCVIGYNPKEGPYSYGSVSTWAYNAWKALGHDAEMFDRSEMQNLPKKADLYFFVDVSEDYSVSMPQDLEGLKVFWAMDTAMPGGMERSVNIGRRVDYVFCTNAEVNGPEAFAKRGIEAMWVPYGYDDGLAGEILMHPNSHHDSLFDVCMIGNPNSSARLELWKLLKEKYGDRAFVGTVQDRKEYVSVKAASMMMIAQPTEPFNHIINLRIWNALCNRKFLLCKRPAIDEHQLLGLIDGENIVYWDDFEDLIKKIDYYLVNEAKREYIVDKGWEIGRKHFMTHSIRIIEQILYSKFYKELTAEFEGN